MKRIFRKFVMPVLSLLLLLSLVWPSHPALADDSPTCTAAIANTHNITLTFSKAMIDPWGLDDGGFSYTIKKGDLPENTHEVTSISFNPDNPTVYILELHAGIQPDDIVTLSYTPGATPIQSVDGGDLQEFSNLELENTLSTVAPYIFVVTTQDENNSYNNDGTYLSVAFSLPMLDPPATPGDFKVNIVDNNGTAISEIAITSISKKMIYYENGIEYCGNWLFRLQTPIQYGQNVRISYTPGTVQSVYGVLMAADNNHYVNNGVPQPVSADLTDIVLSGNPSGFTFSGSTYSYNNVTVANNVSSITVTPTGAGTITVNGTPVTSGSPSGEIALAEGVQQTILVTTTEPGKAARTYTIKVTRLEPTPAWNRGINTSWYDPDESEYTITDAAGLTGLAELVNGGNNFSGKTIKLGADIALNDTTGWENWNGSTTGLNAWTPIGGYYDDEDDVLRSFSGTFDGQNHTVSGIYISTDSNYQGLFGYCVGGTVKNLSVTQSYIEGGYYVGAIAGSAKNAAISGCHFTGKLTGGGEIGGIVGYGLSITVSNCSSAGLISAPGAYNVGGIAGSAGKDYDTEPETETLIEECYSTADVSGAEYVGGIVGYLRDGSTVSACYSTGDVSADGNGAGGIAGIMQGCSINRCYATGYITGSNHVGGIAGYSAAGSGANTIQNCIALNYAVAAGSGANYIFRVSNRAEGNYAWEDMTVLMGGSVYDGNTFGGATPVTTEDLKAATYWEAAGFTAENGWTYTAGKLPILTNTCGLQNSDLPLYIDPFPASAGTGTEADPYKISEAVQLAAVAKYVSSGTGSYASAYYELQNDIDLGIIPQWEAIGIGEPSNGICHHPFTGSFDGKGYEIRNMKISGLDNWYQGLFGYIGSGGIVKNVILTNCDVTCQANQIYMGGIAGGVGPGAAIERCTVSGSISGCSEVGGIAGGVYGTVRLCRSGADITSIGESSNFGGIAGCVGETGIVENCYSTGNVTGDSAGNIAGYSYGTVTNCYYLDGAAPGSGEVVGSIEAKTAAELASAEMAWILNTANGTEANSGIWAQGTTPVFADSTHKAVYRLKLEGCATPAAYSNPNGTVTLPSAPTGTNGMAFLGWYEDAAYIMSYTVPATLTADDTIYGNFGTRILSLADDVSVHTYNGAPVTFAGTLTDNASGIAGTSPVTYTYYTDQSGTLTTAANGAATDGAAPKNAGSYYAKATAAANAVANGAESGYAAMTISKADPVITVTTDHPSGQKYGQNVTVTVTVAPPSGNPTDGFPTADEIYLAATGATLVSALAGTATPESYTAVYKMPDDYSPGQQAVFTATIPSAAENYNAYTAADKKASVTLLDKNATVTQVMVSDDSITYGEAVAVTATVSADGAPVLTGTVQFTLDGVNAGDATAVSGNKASLTLDKTRLQYKAGTYDVEAVFTPDGESSGDYAGSSGIAHITVAKKTLTIRPRNEAIKVGVPLPTPMLTYSGFVTGETEAVLTVTTPFEMEIQKADGSTLTNSSKTGTYSIVITAGAVTAGNYEIVLANGTLTISGGGGGSGGGSSPGGSSEAPAIPDYKADVKSGDGNETTVPVTVDEGSGTASIEPDSQALAQGGNVTVTMPSVSGVTNYTVEIPVANLTAPNGGTLTFNADTGSITIPSDMLSGITEAEGKKAEVTIGTGDKAGLPDEVKMAVGDRPLIALSLTVDGKQINWNNPNAPVTVSIPYTPTEEELANPESIVVWYIDGTGKAVSVPNGRYDPATGNVTFTTTHFSHYAVAYSPLSFSDVAADAWYEKAVSFIAAREITTGTGRGNFSPEAKLTRGQFIVMLMKAYGIAPDANPKDNFADAGNTWYTGHLAAAKRLRISAGVGSNLFAPGKEITRQEMFTLLCNALKVIGQLPEGSYGKTLSDFTDSDTIAPWAKDAMMLLVGAGTVGGSDGKLTPQGTTTRAEMAQVLYNLLGK